MRTISCGFQLLTRTALCPKLNWLRLARLGRGDATVEPTRYGQFRVWPHRRFSAQHTDNPVLLKLVLLAPDQFANLAAQKQRQNWNTVPDVRGPNSNRSRRVGTAAEPQLQPAFGRGAGCSGGVGLGPRPCMELVRGLGYQQKRQIVRFNRRPPSPLRDRVRHPR
jgi:hypothetical protein